MENEKQNEMVIPQSLFNELIGNKIQKTYNPSIKTNRETGRENIKLDDKHLNEELLETMNKPQYFTDTALQIGFNINLDSHYINHATFKLTIEPKPNEFGFEFGYTKKVKKEISIISSNRRNG